MTRIHLLCSMAFLMNAFGLVAQGEEKSSAPTYEVLQRPREFQEMLSDNIERDYLKNPNADFTALHYDSGKDWKAWSDRASNPVYEGPNITTIVSYLDFGQGVMITDKNNKGWLEIATRESMVDGRGPVGWISGVKLILSPNPLVMEGIVRKAMVMSNASTVSDLENRNLNVAVTAVYSNPNTTTANRMRSKSANVFQIFYILKETNDAYLVSYISDLKEGDSAIYGWMPKSNLTDWNSRVCYAPNYGSRALSAYPHPLPFTFSKSDLSSYSPNQRFDDGIGGPKFEFKVGQNEFPSYMPRWPDIGKTRYSGQLEREVLMIAGTSMIRDDAGKLNEAINEVEDLKRKISNVNLIFVLDATSSMSRYYSNIAQSIEQICEITKEWDGDVVNLEVSVGFYRDYADGAKSWQVEPKQQYTKHISDIIRGQTCYSVDPDRSEAVYQGIIKTLELSGVGKDESNIVVLIGDDGNHEKDNRYDRDEVLNKLKEYNAKLYVFQSTAHMQAESMKFQEDAIYWLKGINRDPDFKLSFIEPGLYGLVKDDDKPDFSGEYGRLRTSSKEAGIPTIPKLMEKQIGKEIDSWIVSVKDRISFLESVIAGVSGSTEFDCMELFKAGVVSKTTALILCEARSDISFSAHTVVGAQGVSENCLIPYVFLSRTEFGNLKNEFKSLSNAGNDLKQKEALKSLMTGMIRRITGGSVSEMELYKNKSMEELWEKLFQVRFNISEIKDDKLKDLEGIPSSRFSIAYQALVDRAQEFETIDLKEYKWKKIGGEEFYWIPAAYFPGF
jgi:hypothetical protein